MSETEIAEHEVVSLGSCVLDNDKRGVRLILKAQLDELINAGAHNDTILFASSPFGAKGTPEIPGSIYKLQCRLDDRRIVSIRPGDYQFVSRGDYGLTPVWTAAGKAASLRIASFAQEKKAATSNELQRNLDALAWTYKKLPNNAKNAFKLMVLDALDKR